MTLFLVGFFIGFVVGAIVTSKIMAGAAAEMIIEEREKWP
jgi:hypothetical protein